MKVETIVLASGNKGKLREIQTALAEFSVKVEPQSNYQMPDVPETGLSFVENALLKARACAEHTGLPALADDSGLAVDYLNGAPGIYSARYAGEAKDDAANNRKLLDALRDVPEAERSAQFVCALAFVRHANDPLPLIVQGLWSGRILTAPSGEGGFGYDPIFYVPERDCSAAALSHDDKCTISHRGKALIEFIKQFAKRY